MLLFVLKDSYISAERLSLELLIEISSLKKISKMADFCLAMLKTICDFCTINLFIHRDNLNSGFLFVSLHSFLK